MRGMERAREAVGHHEVVVESRAHNVTAAQYTRADMRRVVCALHQRGTQLAAEPAVRHIMYFKNQGAHAGASMIHPHSQIVAFPVVPDSIKWTLAHCMREFELSGHSAFHEFVNHELGGGSCDADPGRDPQDGGRVVDCNEHFISVVPFAASSRCQVYIVPRVPFQSAHFLEATQPQLASFADILLLALRRIDAALSGPDFNFIIRSAPLPGRHLQRAYNTSAYFSWHAVIYPRLGSGETAGFEFCSGMCSNQHLPENDAALLRGVALGPL